MYTQAANTRVPTIRVAAAIAKRTRLSRFGRRIGHISADEVDVMIRTKKGKLRMRRGGPYCLQSGCNVQAAWSRNSAERGLILFRRVDVDEEPLSVAQMREFSEADPPRRNPRVEQIDL